MERSLANSEIESIVFSDSIVLTKTGREPDSLHALCEICSRLMYELISVDIPVRGAIAYGNFVRSHIGTSVFLAGGPILEAYDYEKKQDWIGMMLTRSAIKEAHEIDFPKTCTTALYNDEAFPNLADALKWKAYVQRARIPLHGDSHDGFAIVPGGATSLREMTTNLAKMLERLEWLKIVAPTPADQRKYSHTIEWLKATLLSTWQSRADDYERWLKDHPPAAAEA